MHFIFPVPATRPTDLILRHLIILTTFHEEYYEAPQILTWTEKFFADRQWLISVEW
jgi:hypothetical protein